MNCYSNRICPDFDFSYLAGTRDGKKFLSTPWPIIGPREIEWTPFPSHAYRFIREADIRNFLKGHKDLMAYLYETTLTRTGV